MAQVNKYTDKSAYTADKTRLSTKSAISYIGQSSATVYDGVNVVVGKNSADVGDLVVFDKADRALKFIKAQTLVYAQLQSNLVAMAVVYGRKGAKVLILSLTNATFGGSASVRWAYPYEVKLSGFDLAAGGTFALRIHTTEHQFTYAAGATLADIAANIAANLPNYNKADYGGWIARAEESLSAIVMTSNTYSSVYATISATGCTLTHRADDVNYQTRLTGVLIDGTIENLRRKNDVDSPIAGCNPEKFLQYYSVNGGEQTGQLPGSSNIIRESIFTQAANPALVAAYPTYRDYLFSEHLIEHPTGFGAVLRDGRKNTQAAGNLFFADIFGNQQPQFPACASALAFAKPVEGFETGLEVGAWWLPSVDEVITLMRDRVLLAADRERDPINLTLSRVSGAAPCYGTAYLWTSCEYSSSGAFFYYGSTGGVFDSYKYSAFSVRPVSAL